MLRLFTSIAALFFSLALFAIDKAALPAIKKCTIEGQVVKAIGGKALKGAGVQLKSVGTENLFYAVKTDAEGKFVIRDIQPGRYRLSIWRSGYAPQAYPSQGVLSLESGQEVNDLLFRLLANPSITGRVVDENDNPLAGIEVQALKAINQRVRRKLT